MRLALVLVMMWMSVARADDMVPFFGHHPDPIRCTHGTVTVGDFEYETGQLESPGPKISKDRHSTDNTPPAAPRDVVLSLRSDEDGNYDSLSFPGTYAPDTAYIVLSTKWGGGLITTPDRTTVCSDGNALMQHEHITITAYDEAGNASKPFERDVVVAGVVRNTDTVRELDPNGIDMLFLVGSIVASLGFFAIVLVIGSALKKAPSSVFGEPLSPILAENVARTVARAYLIKLAISMGVVLGLATLHHPYIAIVCAPFPVAWLVDTVLARLALAQLDGKIERLEKRDNWIYINTRKLYAPRRVWAKASSLPTAGLA